MVICGQEFDFSLMNANDLDRFEDANDRMQRKSAEEAEQFQRGGVRLGAHVRAQTRIAMECIDEILGEGASARLGLDENNMAPVYDVIEELGNAFAAEKQRYTNRAAQPLNREQRRAQAKKDRHQKPVSRSEGFHPQVVNRPVQQPVTEKNVFWPDTEADAHSKTSQLMDARQAVNNLRDDPDAMQQLAAYVLQVAAERHV